MTATATTVEAVRTGRPTTTGISLSRSVRVELRKMFDTRAGFWLIASIAIAGLLATVATIAFAPDKDLTYYTFAKSIGFPITILLPLVALLSVTSEWSQRSGLTTYTLQPNRKRVILAKVVASVTVAVASMLFAFAIGAVGNVVGTAIADTPLVWDVSVAHALTIVLGNLTCLLTGTVIGMILRSSPGGLVVYFVLSLVLPTLFGFLASSQAGFQDVRPWVDLNYAQSFLFEGMHTGAQWAHIASTVAIWIVLPGILGLRLVTRSEVK